MFVQGSDYSVRLKIVPKPGFAPEDQRAIEAVVAANLPGLTVTTDLVDEIPRTKAGKWRPVVSEVTFAATGAP